MSHFDDWKPLQDDWGDTSETSDFTFGGRESDDFGFVAGSKKSPSDRLRSLPPWAKVSAPVAVGLVLIFILVQAEIPLLRGLGLFRENVSVAAACLNSYQVLAAASTGTVNQMSMNRAVDYATRLKGQQSPDGAVNAAMWTVGDATFTLDRALANADFNITLSDITTGDFESMGFTPELNEAALQLSSATEQLNSACSDIDVTDDEGSINAQESTNPSQGPSEVDLPQEEDSRDVSDGGSSESTRPEPSDGGTDSRSDSFNPPSDGLPMSDSDLIALAKQATFYVECWTGGQEVAVGTAFLADLSGIGVSEDGAKRVITNHHVIEDCLGGGELSIQDDDGQWFEATVVDADAGRDIAFLDTAAGAGLEPLGVERSFSIGEQVVLSGHPDGIDTAVTFGRVTVFDADEYLIFSDALAGPGSSGGPMINTDGQVVGIVTYILEVTRGMSIASPVDAVCFSLESC